MRPSPAHVDDGADAGSNLHPLEALRLFRSAGGALGVQALLHGELAAVEWELEKNRLVRMLRIGLVGFACLLSGLLTLSALVMAATWDSAWRFPAAAGLLLLFAAGTVAAGWRLRTEAVRGKGSFAVSRVELGADAALLRAST